MKFIGDIHAKLYDYSQLIRKCDGPSIQVGDFGYGFFSDQFKEKTFKNLDMTQHKFIRGNHDCPSLAKKQPTFIKDGSVYNNVFCVGGAWSIDKNMRTPGIDWWKDEELSYEEFGHVIDAYSIIKPDIVCTHDCPSSASYEMFVKKYNKPNYKTLTGNALQIMFEIHQPKFWVFGHWHTDMVMKMDGTKFICVGELSHIDIDLEQMKIVDGSSDVFRIHKKR